MSDLVHLADGIARLAPANGNGVGTAKLVLLDTGRMLRTDPPPVDWLVEGFVARGTLTLFAGREKEGKSLLCQAFATAMTSGGGIVGGITCRSGRALLVDAENGEAVIHRRLKALGVDVDHADHLHFAEARGFDLRGHLGELGDMIRRVKPDLVVLDSWRSLWAGKENDSDEVAMCLDPLRVLARTLAVGVVLIHHMSRSGAYRGSTAAGASVENILTFERLADDSDRRRRRLRNVGCRYEEEADDRWLSVEADRRLGLVLVEETDPFDGVDAPLITTAPVREELAPRVLGALALQPRQSQAAIARALGRDPKDQSVRRTLRAFRENGTAIRDDDGWGLAPGVTPSATTGAIDTLTPDTPPTAGYEPPRPSIAVFDYDPEEEM